ncbi:flavin-containing monooxygenase [Acinetobacter larvae]|uniref:Monooxygenase n=1 Tax=Acinetobacter larvae TaxID=1789224 RepID=A0A1B2LWG1_9GAMM|nr:NAD(P)/FAD-dependent oxidoreductase [Acinetobacter larvae]AOA57286.1 monooxygenase [Acinetobacter larvae]
MDKFVDVLIIGAGISGIGMAVHLLKKCSKQQFAILERRNNIGGTWDLFRYPGIRSDSDMTTFGYQFKPWERDSFLANGASIRHYLQEVVDEFGLENKIHFNHQVERANFDRQQQKWCVELLDSTGQAQLWHANFIVSCTGYYHYQQGYLPRFPHQNTFQGTIIHPQHWPKELDYSNKNIVVIGSGATAMTLLPALVAGGAAHVTMLQRSPTYVVSVAGIDFIYQKLRQYLPAQHAYQLTRVRNIAVQRAVYYLSQKYPRLVRAILLQRIKKQLKDKENLKHFKPNYNPWDQRLCVIPDGDLFEVLNRQQASIVTDHIERFTEDGILLQSGTLLNADIIVSATGLNIEVLGGIKISIDGQAVNPADQLLYQGVLVSQLPNFAMMMGYINASWTLKVDIAADYVCRLLNYMQQHHFRQVVAGHQDSDKTDLTVMGDLSAGYIQRAFAHMPKQGKAAPWKNTHNYLLDRKVLKNASFEDDILKFQS